MRQSIVVGLVFVLASLCGVSSAFAGEKIADVISASPQFAAGGKTLTAGSTVAHRERVSTSGSGRGELYFIDGTKLALGPSSSLTITNSLMRGKNKFAKLGLVASRGAFRWISGSSGSSAYALRTPLSTIGIRGTALDITVRGGKTYVALLSGQAQVCGRGGCQTLNRTCDFVEVSNKISKTQQISAGFKSRADAAGVFPFLANPGLLSSRLRVGGGRCLSAAFIRAGQEKPVKGVKAAAALPPGPPPSPPPGPPPSPPPSPPDAPGNSCSTNCGNGVGNGGAGNGRPNEGKGNN